MATWQGWEYYEGDNLEFFGADGKMYNGVIRADGFIDGFRTLHNPITDPFGFWNTQRRQLVRVNKKPMSEFKNRYNPYSSYYPTNSQTFTNIYEPNLGELGVDPIDNKPKKTIMKTLSNYYKKLTDADTQALVKAGYLNGDLEPTCKADAAIKEINFFTLKAQLVEKAKEEILEAEKVEKKD